MKAWEDLLTSLENEIGPQAVQEWLRPIKILRFDARNIYLEAEPFQITWFEEQVRPRIGSFVDSNQRPIKIHFEKQKNSKLKAHEEPLFQIFPDPLETEFRLDLFLSSHENSLALEMAKDLSVSGKSSFNPLYIFGPNGSGKTHLLTGIALSLSKLGKKVFYVKAETLTDHVVQAIRLSHMLELRKAYREIDYLIVDDIHLLARRVATQEEFFHTFNALHTMGRQIILSGDNTPQHLQDIEPRLISRFEWGIALNLSAPDASMIRQILMQKADLLHLTLTPALIDFLIERFPSKISAPIEALHALAIRSAHNLDPVHAEKILADLLAKESASLLTPEKIIKEIASYFGIRTEDLTGDSQMREFAQPRQIAMFLCRNLLEMPYQAIGRLFHRDHSTVMTSVKQVKAAFENKEQPFFEPLNVILRKLYRT